MKIIEIPLSELNKKNTFSCLESNLEKIIDTLSKENNLFALLSLYELHLNGKFNSFQDHFKFLIDNRRDENISLWNGDGLFIYISCLLYQSTKNTYYIEEAVELVNNANLDDIYCENSLFDGYAGFVLSLLLLLRYTQSRSIIDKTNDSINKLLVNIEFDEFGISWRETNQNPHIVLKPQHIKNLCGFGNGAAGVTYLFCYLSEIFQNEALMYVAYQALLRQDGLYNEKTSNWPDFNSKINSASDQNKHKKEYKNNNEKWSLPNYENYSLYGGAIGISLANILMYDITQDVNQRNTFYRALNNINILLDKKHPFTSDQIAEIGILLLAGYKILQDAKLLTIIEKLIETLNEDIQEALTNKNMAYFYFLISCIYPSNNFIPGIENSPVPSKKNLAIAQVTKNDIIKILLKKIFARTIEVMELSNINFPNISYNKRHLINSFVQNINTNRENISNDRFNEIFELELNTFDLQNSVQSRSFCFAKGLQSYRKYDFLINLELKDFLKEELVLNPACELVELSYDWHRAIDWDLNVVKRGVILNILDNIPNQTYLLIYIRNNGYVMEKPLIGNDMILITFQEPSSIENAYKEVTDILKPQDQNYLNRIMEGMRESILYHFQEGVLILK